MQITRIECELGVTVNAGDFQSVKATVKACADVDRNEDADAAYLTLANFVRSSLIQGANAAHPDAVRKMLTADARLSEAAQGNAAAAQATTRKRRTKEEIAADEAAAKAALAAPKTQTLAATGDGDLGGLDKEAALDAPAGDELDDLLGDGAAEAVTREQVQEALVKLNKKGGKGAVLEILKKLGVSSLGQLPESKYAEAKKATDAAADAIKS